MPQNRAAAAAGNAADAAEFAVVEATNSSSHQGTGGSGGTVRVDLPAGIEAGDRLLVFLGLVASVNIGTWPGGLTQLFDTGQTTGGDGVRFSAAWKVAAGSEGSFIDVPVPFYSANGPALSYRISGAGDIEASTPAGGTGSDPDAPDFTPSFGNRKILWIPACAISRPGSSLSGYPGGYTDGFNRLANGNGNISGNARVASARAEIQAASENPGVFDINTFDAASDWIAVTVAVNSA